MGQEDADNALPLYKRIYEQLLEQISSGGLKAGDRVPSEKEICDTYGVSRITSKKALEMLAEHHLIARWRGKGSFVAGSPVQGNFRSIALLLSTFNDAFGARLVGSVEEMCNALGYHLILRRTRESPAEEEKALRELDDEAVSGILMVPVRGEYYNAEILQQIINKRPLVFVDRRMRGLPVPSVSTDNAAAAESAVKHLLDLGHRKIAFYSGPANHTSTVEDRRQGFVKAFADSGIPLESAHVCSNLLSQDDVSIVTRHLSEHPAITAAFTVEYEIALRVKNAVMSLGQQIHRDFSIITFDYPGNGWESPAFTYMRQDEEAIGKQAVETLHRIIRKEAAASGEILVPAELVCGDSVKELKSGI
ncbi:transcriptional regulator [Spirochaetia bacterium]|nr:transcriptional regulator [Spirochaetia bacterium]